MWMVRVREYFLREIGCWKIWIFADTCMYYIQENRTCLCPWPADHVSALACPSLCISGKTPRTVLLRQHCRVGSFLWKPGVSPSWELPWRQLSISSSIYWGSLHWCNFCCGEVDSDSSGCSGWKPAICFQVSTGGLWQSSLLWLFASFSVTWSRTADLSQNHYGFPSLCSWTAIYFPFVSLKLFYPTLSPNGLIVLASFLILNLSYFISNNKNNKETEEKSPAILPSYYGNYAHFPVFSSNSSPYKYIFYTAILHCVIISLRQAYHISFYSCLRKSQLFFTEACLYLLFL